MPEIASGCELYLGDCLDVLPTLDIQVDAIILDLPYGTTACDWDSVIPLEPMWEQVKRLLKPRGAFVTTASQPFTSKLVMSNPKWFKHDWVWNKDLAGNGPLARYQPLKIHESVIVFCNGAVQYNPQGTKPCNKKNYRSNTEVGNSGKHSYIQTETNFPKSILDLGHESRLTNQHPTQKPVALYEYLIRTYTNPGDVVLDFCMGSGTTGVAAIQTGRKFIGIERERKYYRIAEKRIAQAQPPLFIPVGEKLELAP